jgi:predicted DNA-binding protein (UPF0251 family)
MFMPQVRYFKPAGVPLRVLQEVRVSVEEAEAVRLKDIEGLEQRDCAERMNVSRTTFARVLNRGRRKMAEALLGGKAIRINGGNFEIALRRFRCHGGHEWELPLEGLVAGSPQRCPTCSTEQIEPVKVAGSERIGERIGQT